MDTCSGVSTPSAMMGRLSRCAISTTDSTICTPLSWFFWFMSMSFMSSLMASTLVSLSMLSEEYPLPKSSIITEKPLRCRP